MDFHHDDITTIHTHMKNTKIMKTTNTTITRTWEQVLWQAGNSPGKWIFLWKFSVKIFCGQGTNALFLYPELFLFWDWRVSAWLELWTGLYVSISLHHKIICHHTPSRDDVSRKWSQHNRSGDMWPACQAQYPSNFDAILQPLSHPTTQYPPQYPAQYPP